MFKLSFVFSHFFQCSKIGFNLQTMTSQYKKDNLPLYLTPEGEIERRKTVLVNEIFH
jgi:hypothetical protein